MPGTGTRHAARPRVRARVRAAAAVFPDHSPLAREPVLREYLADLAAPYGAALREDLLAAGAGHSYGEMGEQLLSGLVTEDDPADLLILAYDVPDVRPGRSTALYLSSVCPGRPDAFAVSDQGVAAAFTAIRLAAAHLAADYHSAVVLVLEQSALHCVLPANAAEPGPAAPAPPERHAGVALRFDGEAPKVTQYTDIGAEEAVWRVTDIGATDIGAEEVAAAEPAVLVLGQGLRGVKTAAGSSEIFHTRAQPSTGIWAAYAECGAQWAAQRRRVVLADHDARMRVLSLCVFEPEDGAAR